jgi:integrase
MTRPLPAPTFGHAAEAFVVAHEAPGAWAKGTAVKYRQTLAAIGGQLAKGRAGLRRRRRGARLPARRHRAGSRVRRRVRDARPATRARHLSALRSAITWWAEADWVTGDPTAGSARPKVPVDTTRALTRAQVTAIWKLDVPLRDKALWRMLYETAARAEEVLGLDAGDLDMPGKRGRVISKGGSTDWVHWRRAAAAPAAGRPPRGPGVPHYAPARPPGRRRGPVPRHRQGQAVLPPRRGVLRARGPAPRQSWRDAGGARGGGRLDPAPAPALCSRLVVVSRLAPESRAICGFRLRRAVSCFYGYGS